MDFEVAARLEMHYAVQFLAAFARVKIKAMPDESHKAMLFQEEELCFETKDSPHGKVKYYPVTHKITLEKSTQEREIFLGGKTWNEVIKEMQTFFSEESLQWPQYPEFPEYKIQHGEPFSNHLQEDRTKLTQLFAYAKRNLSQLGFVKANKIQVWPHHFDMAYYHPFSETKGVGIGFSPGDEHYSHPYYYMSPWPYPDKRDLPTLARPAFWHTENFTSAIIQVSQLPDKGEGESVVPLLKKTWIVVKTVMEK
ncbi:MAG: hypothetical protein D6767_02120 [Candidatus Hydrogenedentota bacterium]|nr:MAG: hypothetical protein D6767_02120 [Candidatus Hydrogenedentota bacterium]